MRYISKPQITNGGPESLDKAKSMQWVPSYFTASTKYKGTDQIGQCENSNMITLQHSDFFCAEMEHI